MKIYFVPMFPFISMLSSVLKIISYPLIRTCSFVVRDALAKHWEALKYSGLSD